MICKGKAKHPYLQLLYFSSGHTATNIYFLSKHNKPNIVILSFCTQNRDPYEPYAHLYPPAGFWIFDNPFYTGSDKTLFRALVRSKKQPIRGLWCARSKTH
jgi:hypothetical protein